MVGHRQGTVLAIDLFAATPTHHHGRIAPAIEQNDGLLAALERRTRLFHEPPGEDLLLAGLRIFEAHVDELD